MHDWNPCDLYDAYHAARDEAEAALAHWSAAPTGLKGDAFAAYRSAADRENAAAAAWIGARRVHDAGVALDRAPGGTASR